MYLPKLLSKWNPQGTLLTQKLGASLYSTHQREYSHAGPRTCAEQVKALNEKETKPASHVIIDLDGVILDSLSSVQKSHDLYLMKWKKSLNSKQRYEMIGRRDKDAGEIIAKDLGLPINGEVYANGVWQYQRSLFRRLKLKKGVEEFLCYFKNKKIPIALVTSSHKKSFKIKTKPHPNLLNMFCHVVTGDDKEVVHGIPEPDLFEVAASRFQNAPKEMHKYVVVHSCLSGINAAKKAGMQTVLFPDRAIPPTLYKKADVILMDLAKFDPADFDFPLK